MSDESARLETLLQSVPIFAVLERVELARLVGTLEEGDFSSRQVIFEEGGESDGVYVVQSGHVHLTVRTPAGEKVILDVGAGGHFGEVGVFLDRRTASAVARTDVKLWKLPRERFEELLRESPAFALAVAGCWPPATTTACAPRSALPPPRRPPPGRLVPRAASRPRRGSRCGASW